MPPTWHRWNIRTAAACRSRCPRSLHRRPGTARRSGHGRVWGRPPGKTGPSVRRTACYRFRVPDEQRHDGRRQYRGVQNDRRHGIASAHTICPSKPSVLAMSRLGVNHSTLGAGARPDLFGCDAGSGRSRDLVAANVSWNTCCSRRGYRESGVRRTNPEFWNPSRRVHRSDHDAVFRCSCLVATQSSHQ